MKHDEKWAPVDGYENYVVSNYGKVMNTNTGKSIMNNKKGRPFAALFKDGKVKTVYISRLVAQAFIPNPQNYEQVNHINGDPTDNYVENLEWCTREQNYLHCNLFELNIDAKNREGSEIKIFMDYPTTKLLYETMKRERTSVSNLIKKAIEEYVERHPE